MAAGDGHESWLIVGAGLTGAAVAWLASRRGVPTTIVSLDRPGSQGTALSSGIVHGLGPAGGFQSWAHSTPDDLARAAHRASLGFELLRSALLEAPRACGYVPMAHHAVLPASIDTAQVNPVVAALCTAGFPVRTSADSGACQIVRDRDAVVSLRRLSFELLRGARRRGATLRLGARISSTGTGSALSFSLDGQRIEASRVIWAAGRPLSVGTLGDETGERLVLHQRFAAGAVPLERVLAFGNAEVVLSPEPDPSSGVALIRTAEEAFGGGLTWPEPPAEWWSHCGVALRQRLAEALFSSVDVPVTTTGHVTSITGLGGWPLTQVLGLCAEVVALG